MLEAVCDLVVKPYEGIRKDGAKGAVAGIGKGMANMTSKAGCAMFGVVVYPGVGIATNLRSAVYSRTRKRIVKARRVEGHGCWRTADMRRVIATLPASKSCSRVKTPDS